MRHFSVFFLFLALILSALLVDARRSPGDYWKSIMNDEPIPEAITDLLHPDMTSEPDETRLSMVSNHYIREFDIRPNVILYHPDHPDADSKRLKNFADGAKMLHEDDKDVKLKPVVSDAENS